jgi:hypothetical protein
VGLPTLASKTVFSVIEKLFFRIFFVRWAIFVRWASFGAFLEALRRADALVLLFPGALAQKHYNAHQSHVPRQNTKKQKSHRRVQYRAESTAEFVYLGGAEEEAASLAVKVLSVTSAVKFIQFRVGSKR